jgi:hypothetical protein
MFGVGTIVEVDEKKRAYVVKFEGLETPRKLSGRVKLERI